MSSDGAIRKSMKEIFGYEDFLSEEQEESVKIVLSGAKNVFISMPTNSGKSLCFYLASVLLKKTSNPSLVLVISPNLALMENHMNFLRKHGLSTESINSIKGKTKYDDRDEIERRLKNGEDTETRFLFMTPEMCLIKKYVLDAMFLRNRISHVVIDEAHFVLDSFRENYRTKNLQQLKLKIPKVPSISAKLRFENPDVPFILLTTASDSIIVKILKALGMDKDKENVPKIIHQSSERNNIFYEVSEVAENNEIDIVGYLNRIFPGFVDLAPEKMPSGIIYCTNVANLNHIWSMLQKLNIPATVFYADLKDRFENYKKWMSNEVPIIVATTESFGVGIVRDDVKFVIHANIPRNLRAYYQESGRARADKSYSCIFYKKTDFLFNDDVKKYCLTPVCRRLKLGNHFGDLVNYCHNMCDNCIKNK